MLHIESTVKPFSNAERCASIKRFIDTEEKCALSLSPPSPHSVHLNTFILLYLCQAWDHHKVHADPSIANRFLCLVYAQLDFLWRKSMAFAAWDLMRPDWFCAVGCTCMLVCCGTLRIVKNCERTWLPKWHTRLAFFSARDINPSKEGASSFSGDQTVVVDAVSQT